jgi:hypothetical protein
MAARAAKWLKAVFQPKDPADVPLVVKGAASQSANLLEVQDSTGAVKFRVEKEGMGVERYAEVSIAAAAVATLRAAPVTLVAAPGAGKILQFVSAVLILDYTAPGFTETTDNLAVKYGDGNGVAVSQTIECTGFIDQTADMVTNAVPKTDVIATKAQCENVPLVLHNTGDGEFGGSGGSTLRVKVVYRVHNSGL